MNADTAGPAISIAPMNRDTVEAVAALEQECFSAPWSLDALAGELANPLAVYLVAQVDGAVAGYAGMHHILDEGYITNIAVGGRFRRMGVASALLRAQLAYARENRLRLLTLEVRVSNTPARALYETFRFQPVGLRRHYYKNPAEGALILTREL